MSQVETFSRRLNSNEGSLGQLINDPELYNNVRDAAANIRNVTSRLEPIINDLRVFTDKIARDPGRLGVSGALQRNAKTKFPSFRRIEPPPLDWRQDPSER